MLLVQAEMGAPAFGFCVHRGRIHSTILPCQFFSRCVCSPFWVALRGLQYGTNAVSSCSYLSGHRRNRPLLPASLPKYCARDERGLRSICPLPWAFRHEDFVDSCTTSCSGRPGAQLFANGRYLFGRICYLEKIFSLPGLGYSIVDSVLYRDTPMIHATILFLAFFLVICNTVSDILQRIFQRGHAEGVSQ